MKKIFVVTILFLVSLMFYNPVEETTTIESPKLCYVEIKGEVLRPQTYKVPINTSYLEASSLAGFTKYSVVINETKKVLEDTSIIVEKRVGNININNATLDELDSLPGIGKLKAEKILEYRNKHKFNTWDEFKKILNIKDEKILNKIKLQAFIG